MVGFRKSYPTPQTDPLRIYWLVSYLKLLLSVSPLHLGTPPATRFFVRIPIFNVKIYVPFRNKMSAFCKFSKASRVGTMLAHVYMNLNSLTS